MKESKNFWSINIKDIKQDTFDLSIKNLNAKEEAPLRSPEEILKEVDKLDIENVKALASIKRDLCINMNNHQNAIFRQLDNFIKHSHSFAMTIFHKITHSAKLVILLIIPTYAKVSKRML
ncbi:hypothetical protein [bacterium endosymbiont of Bathymodiolus sp. 5 South]|jgi:hypothetical protein|uniref:hypothetical protein n=2 Tax=bacterium endosymbiont of Bathymodiolus sp. 5 South TaxID=1181670 RepID=UPI0010B5D44A|nr:hypothetical protein [bacterium endosymbiont of Bathymodiolus sp. 5 South]CAC9651254.1 hypothetical protein [uncultured Gammaproteobacteria bacterium]SHN91992.1 hypothetical protein BCLUESOX_2234 [bacterium endosymbiont of Bathymodiolus sp. 5 South]SSC09175.1 hypothetical protein BTURTLESOX_1359 [bacterium endosymbiont of Bathymodiolus sp. 5 South]VVH57675.1 hypothetical protein BSPCLSOX_1801 [uncultured Gammaproteobacteria bacterium]